MSKHTWFDAAEIEAKLSTKYLAKDKQKFCAFKCTTGHLLK